MNLTTFTNMQPEEFFYLNQDKLPPEFMKYLKEYSDLNEELQDDITFARDEAESYGEQVYFAKNLIKEIDKFAEEHLTTPDLKAYNLIRENTYFEV